jgi:hypothetical protein
MLGSTWLRIGLVIVVVGIGAAAAGAFAVFGLTSAATVEFSFAAPDNKGSMIYRCQKLDTGQKTEDNARAAHKFFAPALIETARVQGELMARSMSPTRSSADTIPELEHINASADAQRKMLHQDMQSRFGCSYRGG